MPKRGLAVAMLALTLALGAFPRAVLCVSASGHLAIESAAADCCPPVSAHAEGILHGNDRCASECTDTPLGLSLVSRTFDGSDAPAWTAHSALGAPLLHAADASYARVALEQSSGRALRPPRSLRTTVHLR